MFTLSQILSGVYLWWLSFIILNILYYLLIKLAIQARYTYTNKGLLSIIMIMGYVMMFVAYP